MAYVAVLVLVTQSWAAGVWEKVPLPSAIDNQHPIRDCEADSEGNLYYAATLVGFYSQSPDGKSFTKHSGVPKSDSSGYIGIYVDPNTDSVFVGTVRGMIQYGKDGVFHELPPVPLTVMGSQYTSTRVHDIERDLDGNLVAVTDSLAWWFDGSAWHIIGAKADYRRGSIGYLEFALKMSNGDILSQRNIIHSDRSITPIELVGYGVSLGASGTIYAGGGGSFQELYYSLPPYTKVDTMDLTQLGENYMENGAGAVYEDKNGWMWVPQRGRFQFYKNRVLKKVLPGSPISTPEQVPFKMLLAPDSTLWMCAVATIFRYSEKYAIPEEVLAASELRDPAKAKLDGLRIHSIPGALNFENSDNDVWNIQIFNPQGRMEWAGLVPIQPISVPLKPGLWLVMAKSSHGNLLRKMIAVIP